jgi:ribA/ribD-fused uncharacterized protein
MSETVAPNLTNSELLESLFDKGVVHLENSEFLRQAPSPMPQDLDWDKVEGMLLGLAIGDSLGNTSESKSTAMRRKGFGYITEFLPNKLADGKSAGVPSDDTQLAFWMLEQTLEDGKLIPENLAERFCSGRIFGIGQTVKKFLKSFKAGTPWYKAGPEMAGNGALMRIAPVIVPHLKNPSTELWADTVLAGMLTHNDRASTGSCLALVNLIWETLSLKSAPQPSWWLDTFCTTLRQVEGDTKYKSRTPFIPYEGTLWQFTESNVCKALDEGLSVDEACNRWHSAAYLLETVPSVIYILCKRGDSFEEGVMSAVNNTWDNDTTAAIVGAVLGALHGRKGIPERWIDGLLGRTAEEDDGKVFELISRAEDAWSISPRKEKLPDVIDDFHRPYSFLSNFSRSEIEYDGFTYPTLEHAFQAAKCYREEDLARIQKTIRPDWARRAGKSAKLRPDWEVVKFDVMLQLLRQKFAIPKLREKLLSTEDKLLIEKNSHHDTIWGVDAETGEGENHLGKLLMQVRAEILREQ